MIRPGIAVKVSDLAYQYPSSRSAGVLFQLSFEVEAGTAVAIMGENGTGKSTLARLLGRQLSPTAGQIEWADAYREPHEVVYLDQDPWNIVYPWQSVEQGIIWPLRKRGLTERECAVRCEELLVQFGLAGLRKSYPAFISGGQRQRLALARCTGWKPKCLILDESFSAQDPQSHKQVLLNLLRLRSSGVTIFFVTHQRNDLLQLADRCLVLQGADVPIEDLKLGSSVIRQGSGPETAAAQQIVTDAVLRGVL